MSDRDSISGGMTSVEETLKKTIGLPTYLSGDLRRQAVPSISGYVYQSWWSIDAWLQLTDPNEVIYLECAEDLEIVRNDTAISVQVKRNAGTISLGSAKAHKALENFWTLVRKEAHRQITFHYLTTSSVARERGGNFGGVKGIDVWRAAQTNLELATTVAEYLVTKLRASSPLRLFLMHATPQDIQERLIKRVHWLTNQPNLEAVKKSVDDRITVLLNSHHRSLAQIPDVRKYLEAHFWEVVIKPEPSQRCLTYADLLRQTQAATTIKFSVPIEKLPDLLGIVRPGIGLLSLLRQKSPRPPEPLLQRPALTQSIEELVKHRKAVLLTGTVHKGKTTVAQLVCSAMCPEAWWINFTGRAVDQVDNVLLALSGEIESGDCPSLVVIDDLDISLAAHRVYRDSLAMVLHRANSVGRGIIITAQGTTNAVFEFDNVEIRDVPELSAAEIGNLCVDHGCPKEIATKWGSMIAVWTMGHPKLVQVRLAELGSRNWPNPSFTELTTQSAAMTSVRQMARQLLSESVPAPVAEFVYLISESSVPLHRSVAIKLAEGVQGLTNSGDVLDKLAGRWLERLEGEWFRTTQLLKGVAVDVWTLEKRKRAHIHLHDAILSKRKLDPSEAAALLFHAYIGEDPQRLAFTAAQLQTIKGLEAKREVDRQLLWLPYVALETGQCITNDAMAGAILRGLQFSVASTLDIDCLPQICSRWSDDIKRIPHPKAKAASGAIMWLSTGFAQSLKVPLKPRLDAILGITEFPSKLKMDPEVKAILDEQEELRVQFLESVNTMGGLPASGTLAQAMFLCAIRCVRNLADLDELLRWLDSVATEDIRQQFEAMLEWPLVQTLGAFVQGAWAAGHEQTKDWKPWIPLLKRVNDYAKRRSSPRFGCEAAKAGAIILTEYLERSKDALRLLEQAESTFGKSSVLMEQRANVLYQKRDDKSVLEIWYKLTGDPVSRATLDPYAYRRAGISASRLGEWGEAGRIFREAANSIQGGSLELSKFGLSVDAALAIGRSGDQAGAAKLLADAVLSLPAEASKEGNEQWEAVQRVAGSVSTIIENSVWKPTKAEPQIEPGYASSPELRVKKVTPGQAVRSEMTRIQILRLATIILRDPAAFAQDLESLTRSRYFIVRRMANEALLALAFANGAGIGFVEAILALDNAEAEFSSNMKEGVSLLTPDDGPRLGLPVTPERWFGFLVAGAVCAGKKLLANLEIWLHASIRLLGEEASFTKKIRLLLKGASVPTESLYPAIVDTASPEPVRCGAAAQMLSVGMAAERALHVQAFLTSGLVSDESAIHQVLFNLHVARRFADCWRAHAQNPFLFYSPRVSVPALLKTLDLVERGSGTLKSVLVAAASALRQPLGQFIERVL